jgi:hypothetical protein
MEKTTKHQEYMKKIKKRWMDESKKYKENVVHMKEFQEQAYLKKKKDLVDKLKKKEKLLITALKNNEKSKLLEKQKAIELMMEKEKVAKENVAKFIIKQEKERLKLEMD